MAKKKVQRLNVDTKKKTVVVYGSPSRLSDGDKELLQMYLAIGYAVTTEPLPQTEKQKANAKSTLSKIDYVGGTDKKTGKTVDKPLLTDVADKERFLSAKNDDGKFIMMYAKTWANLKLSKDAEKQKEFAELDKAIDELGWQAAFKQRKDAKKSK